MKKEIIGHHFDRDDVFIAIVNHCLEVEETKVIKSHTTVKNIYIDTDTLSKVYNGDKFEIVPFLPCLIAGGHLQCEQSVACITLDWTSMSTYFACFH